MVGRQAEGHIIAHLQKRNRATNRQVENEGSIQFKWTPRDTSSLYFFMSKLVVYKDYNTAYREHQVHLKNKEPVYIWQTYEEAKYYVCYLLEIARSNAYNSYFEYWRINNHPEQLPSRPDNT